MIICPHTRNKSNLTFLFFGMRILLRHEFKRSDYNFACIYACILIHIYFLT